MSTVSITNVKTDIRNSASLDSPQNDISPISISKLESTKKLKKSLEPIGIVESPKMMLPNQIQTPRLLSPSKGSIIMRSSFISSNSCNNLTVLPEVNAERIDVKYQHYITIIMLLITIGLTAYIFTSRIIVIIQSKAYYASFTLVLILFGMIFFSFAIKTVVGSIFVMIIGPLKTLYVNSTYYSAINTDSTIYSPDELPPVVIHIPIYKESFEEVIKLTLQNVFECMKTYKDIGGESKIVVFDDGLQLIANIEKKKRIEFYRKNKIAFIARPPENRIGLFKKASNLNHGINVCNIITQQMDTSNITFREANILYWNEHTEDVIGGNLYMHKDAIILLIDADTRIPNDAIVKTIPEFIIDPNLPYTQHLTMPFTEQCNNYWEQLISFFTKKIYIGGIGFSTALGDCCPLVGHNAFIRWKDLNTYAVNSKYWSEDTVSEDFEFFIRLANNNKFGRYITYTGTSFQEGISLTYIDEIIKMKKFTFGACEMCFNPIKTWFKKGIVSKTLVSFLSSKYIRWYQKVNTCVYLSTYFALAAAFYYVIAEGICSIVYPEFYNNFMIRSFDVMLTCVFIFGITSIVGEIVLQWRLNALNGSNILSLIWDEVKWIPALALYFNSIMFHLTEVSFRYFWGFKAEWGSTVKNVDDLNTFKALTVTLKCFAKEYVFMTLLFAGYLTCSILFNTLSFYNSWSVLSYTSAHILGPILLNPYITSLNY
jgi:hypothetical protein